jgi:hypothetical protein
MEIFAIIVFAACGIFAFFNHVTAAEGAIDPNNTSYATPENLSAKFASQIDSNALYTVYVMRQSGNVERYYENVIGSNVPGLIVPVARRAKIDTVSISKTARGFRIWRTMHNHRGRAEGKRIGGFTIVAQ